MKGEHKEKAFALGERDSYSMCKRKKKFKGSRAGKLAHKLGQRKYQCPICNGWHLTKRSKWNE